MKASIEKVNLEKKEWENKAQKMTQECNSVSSFSVFTFLIVLYTVINKVKFKFRIQMKFIRSLKRFLDSKGEVRGPTRAKIGAVKAEARGDCPKA